MSWRNHLDDVLERRLSRIPSRSPSPASSNRLDVGAFDSHRPRSLTPTSARSSYKHISDFSSVIVSHQDFGRSSSPRLSVSSQQSSRSSSRAQSPRAESVDLRAASPAPSDYSTSSRSYAGSYSEHLGSVKAPNAASYFETGSASLGRPRQLLPLGLHGRPLKPGPQPRAAARIYREIPAPMTYSSGDSRPASLLPTDTSNPLSSSLSSDLDLQGLPLDFQRLVQAAVYKAAASMYSKSNAASLQDAAELHATTMLREHLETTSTSSQGHTQPAAANTSAHNEETVNSSRQNDHAVASVPYSPHVGVGGRRAIEKPKEWKSVLDSPRDSQLARDHHLFLREIPLPSPGQAKLFPASDRPLHKRASGASTGWMFAEAPAERGVEPAGDVLHQQRWQHQQQQQQQQQQQFEQKQQQQQHEQQKQGGRSSLRLPSPSPTPSSSSSSHHPIIPIRPSASISRPSSSLSSADDRARHYHLPARIPSPLPAAHNGQGHVEGNSRPLVTKSISSSSSRRASVTFSPAPIEHLYDVSTSGRGDDDRDNGSANSDGNGSANEYADDHDHEVVGTSSSAISAASTNAAAADDDGYNHESDVTIAQNADERTTALTPLQKTLEQGDDAMVADLMNNLMARDYAAAFDSGAMQRLAGLMNSGIESYEEISWRVVRKMCIHLKATHGDSFSREFIDCQMVPAVLNMLQNDAKDDVVEIGIWCLSELILADGSILDQLRQQGLTLKLCNFCAINFNKHSLMRVVVEMILLLIEEDSVSAKIVHDSLGVKFVLLNLINEEIQHEVEFEEQYVQDCLWILLNICGISNQGALDVVAANGVDLLYYVCECKPGLATMSLKVMRVVLTNYPTIMLAPFLNPHNVKQLSAMVESKDDEVQRLVMEIVARVAAEYRAFVQNKGPERAAQVAAALPVFQHCGAIPALGRALAKLTSVQSNKQDASYEARVWAVQALVHLGKACEGNVVEMKGDGVLVAAVQQLMANNDLPLSTQRAQVMELDALLHPKASCCIIS